MGASCGSGAPGPVTVCFTLLVSFLPSVVQTAPWAAQSVVMGRVMVTSVPESGWTVISQRLLLPFTRLARVTVPPVTSREWSRSVL